MDFGGFLENDKIVGVYSSTISVGQIYNTVVTFPNGVTKEKFFIITGICKDRISTCSVYINSDIPQVAKNRNVDGLYLKIYKKDYPFLDHDSFIDSSTFTSIECEEIGKKLFSKTCKKIKYDLTKPDLDRVVSFLKSSPLLTQEQIEIYFPEDS